MNLDQAIQIVSEVLAGFQGNLQQHHQIQGAWQLVQSQLHDAPEPETDATSDQDPQGE